MFGIFIKKNKYNLLKIDGKTLSKDFDYINDDGTFGIEKDSIVNSIANYYNYYNIKSKQ